MVEAFKIKGGKKLGGELVVEGSKNSALPIMIATLVEKGTYILNNVPNLRDIRTLIKLLESLGLNVQKIGKNSYKIINNGLTSITADYNLVKKMRASFLVFGPMLAHMGEAIVSLPGGCAIGARPVDLHLKGYKAFGADIKIEHGYVYAKAPKLVGTKIVLDFPSVGATENIIMGAVKARGTTTIENAAREPEIEDLCNFFNEMGAKISGIGTATLTIEGVDKLNPTTHDVIPDRIVAGSFIIASIIFDGNIEVVGVVKEHLDAFLSKLSEMGVKYEIIGNRCKIYSKLSDLKGVRIKTMPYPGFPTDLQSPMMMLLSVVKGHSEIKETIFENRFMHIPELNRMGTQIDINGNTASIEGVEKLSSAQVMASDLRAGIALVLATLLANGESIVDRIYHIDRGYEDLDEKLKGIGAEIERIKVEI